MSEQPTPDRAEHQETTAKRFTACTSEPLGSWHRSSQASEPAALTLLIHGLGRVATVWGPLADALARDRDVLAIDNPGFGASRQQLVPKTVREHAELSVVSLRSWLAQRSPPPSPRPLEVVGLSLGGMIALEVGALLAGSAPEGYELRRVSILASSARESGLWRLSPLAVLRLLGRALWHRRHSEASILTEILGPDWERQAPGLDRALPRIMGAAGGGDHRGAFRQLLAAARWKMEPAAQTLRAEPRVHCCVVTGSADRLVSPTHSARMAKRLRAPLITLDGAGHDLSLLPAGPLLPALTAPPTPDRTAELKS